MAIWICITCDLFVCTQNMHIHIDETIDINKEYMSMMKQKSLETLVVTMFAG